MSDPVAAQYEVFPYPERDPKDERKRLIVGSPSDPLEIDHFLFQGKRDWSSPFRALFAGGGTGDGLIQLATRLQAAGCPADILYVDMSRASRSIAEARARERQLTNIRFETADLLRAPDFGAFDYIDCTGVLHHLPDPDAGFQALSDALAPDGGIGLMVYAPYGRTGVYHLQEAFATLLPDEDPAVRLDLGKAVLGNLPEGNWLKRNPYVQDHERGDAGLYDLLLHSRDRPYTVPQLIAALSDAGLGLVSFTQPGLYDPARLLPQRDDISRCLGALDPVARMGLAEALRGDLKTHVLYVAKAERAGQVEAGLKPDAVPRLKAPAAAVARQVAAKGGLSLTLETGKVGIDIDTSLAPAIALADGQRTLTEMAQQLGLDWLAFSTRWAGVERPLRDYGLLQYSTFPGWRAKEKGSRLREP